MIRELLTVLGLGISAGSMPLAPFATAGRGGPGIVAARHVSAPARKKTSCATVTCHVEGYRWYVLIDPDCPGSPDSFESWVEYYDDDENFVEDTYGGQTSYYCSYGFHAAWTTGAMNNCLNGVNAPHGCQQLGSSNPSNTHP